MAVKLPVVFLLLARLSICICNSYGQNSYVVDSNDHGSNFSPCTERYVAEAYFKEYDSLVDSSFQEFMIHKLPVDSGKAFLRLLDLKRNLIGEGSHRRLSSSIRISFQPDLMPSLSSQPFEVIVIERLPSGVFADPFELEHLLERGVFKEASVFGDVNLEMPSFRSNRSVVEIHLDATLTKPSGNEIVQEFKIEIPLHARYPALEDGGYSIVRFGVPDLFIRYKMPGDQPAPSCLLTPIASNLGLKPDDIIWSIPAGIEAHAGIVSVVTFASALLSALLIILASFQHSRTEADERLKRS